MECKAFHRLACLLLNNMEKCLGFILVSYIMDPSLLRSFYTLYIHNIISEGYMSWQTNTQTFSLNDTCLQSNHEFSEILKVQILPTAGRYADNPSKM